MNAGDAVKYTAEHAQQTIDWATDSISGSGCGHDHEDELNALHETRQALADLAREFGDPRRYSDGRSVVTDKAIVDGLFTRHIWHPDPAAEQSQSWRGTLPSGDPHVPSPCRYEVTTDPTRQELHIRVIRVTPPLDLAT